MQAIRIMNGLRFVPQRDKYGRTVIAIYRVGEWTRLGVIVKHPQIAVGKLGAFWIMRWDLGTVIPIELSSRKEAFAKCDEIWAA